MTKRVPIEQRIRDAMAGRQSMQYHTLMELVFPPADYPNSYRYQSNGGPPGCAMAFGAALRRMGLDSFGMGSQKIVGPRAGVVRKG